MGDLSSLTKQAREAVHSDREKHWRDSLGQSPSPKQAWKTARAALGQTSTTQATGVRTAGGGLETNPARVAEAFSKHFQGKVEGLRRNRKASPDLPPSERLRQHLHHKFPQGPPPFQLKEIGEQDLLRLLKRYHGGKALPGDHLDTHIHKVASRVTLKALVSIINRSISESNFCARWKFHVVVPHHKKG